jgi:hypothetical protein
MSVIFLAQGNNGLLLTGFEPMRLAIIRLLVRRVNHSAMPPLGFAQTKRSLAILACLVTATLSLVFPRVKLALFVTVLLIILFAVSAI